MEEKIYTWEALKKINPWKYFFDEYSDKKLRHLICEWKTDFVHPDDKEIISKHNQFALHKLPKPYRGNLKDPRLVILSLNPGFNERVNHKLFNKLSPQYQYEFIDVSKRNLLLEDGCRIITGDVDDICDNGYWTSKLSELELNNDADLSKMGLIQFIPYASTNFSSWKDEASLGTQQFTKKIILRLLYGRKDTLFLVMRSKAQWIKLIGEEMNTFKDRFLYNPNPRNQTLSPNNLKEGYNKILEAFRG